ncbi:proepiregulin-like [Protopterus annectens]|uniref:proepiregulin-like n=1 Tax=Protopterus annectens TaxID=7888 RepID=UPI001CF947E6|nr:proepiregulin-like [Protopterus annectens]
MMRPLDSCILWNSACTFLMLLGFNSMNVAYSGTAAPLCGPVENASGCQDPDSAELPHMAEVRIRNCSQNMENYCLYGTCIFFEDLQEHHCRCEVGYTGSRCMHMELVVQPMSEKFVALTVVLTVLFVTGVSVAIYFIHTWYKKNRREQKEKKYAGLPTSIV